jgi:hypothetical protein
MVYWHSDFPKTFRSGKSASANIPTLDAFRT